jgi:uncharacterized protein YdaT
MEEQINEFVTGDRQTKDSAPPKKSKTQSDWTTNDDDNDNDDGVEQEQAAIDSVQQRLLS